MRDGMDQRVERRAARGLTVIRGRTRQVSRGRARRAEPRGSPRRGGAGTGSRRGRVRRGPTRAGLHGVRRRPRWRVWPTVRTIPAPPRPSRRTAPGSETATGSDVRPRSGTTRSRISNGRRWGESSWRKSRRDGTQGLCAGPQEHERYGQASGDHEATRILAPRWDACHRSRNGRVGACGGRPAGNRLARGTDHHELGVRPSRFAAVRRFRALGSACG